MAKINGIEIKGVKIFLDHESYQIPQGNVYYKGNKLGFWSQDSWGGPDQFEFDTSILDKEVKKYRDSNKVKEEDKSICDLEILLFDLFELNNIENEYKKCIKKGYKSYVRATDGYHICGYYTNELSLEDVFDTPFYRKFFRECENKFFKSWDKKIEIYSSLDDFIIEV